MKIIMQCHFLLKLNSGILIIKAQCHGDINTCAKCNYKLNNVGYKHEHEACIVVTTYAGLVLYGYIVTLLAKSLTRYITNFNKLACNRV